MFNEFIFLFCLHDILINDDSIENWIYFNYTFLLIPWSRQLRVIPMMLQIKSMHLIDDPHDIQSINFLTQQNKIKAWK